MDTGTPASEAQQRLWQSMVRLSAGILLRDCGARAYHQALRRAHREVGSNERAARFWRDVADELAQEAAKQASAIGRSSA